MSDNDPTAAQALVSRAIAAGVLQEAVVERLKEYAATSPVMESVRHWLLNDGRLDSFQLEQLLAGEAGRLRLGPYVLIRPLGSGGMGEVFLARHRLMQREVALKTIRPQRADEEAVSQRFLREIVHSAALFHPNIVMSHDAGEDQGTLYLAMEYIAGRTLAQLVAERGQLSWLESIEFVRQAACGLAYAHEHDLIHRDVKPDNLMLAEPNVVKVMDLGIARMRLHLEEAESLTATGNFIGTVDYMSPEQARDSKNVDFRADIYSLGCTLYFALTGEPPFPGGSLTEKILRHSNESALDVRRLCNAPSALADCVRMMMAKAPEDRHQTMAEVIDALDEIRNRIETPTQFGGVVPDKSAEDTTVILAAGSEQIGRGESSNTQSRTKLERNWIAWLGGGIGLVAMAAIVGVSLPRIFDDDSSGSSPVSPTARHREQADSPSESEWLKPRREFPEFSNAQLPHLTSVATTDQQPVGLPPLMAFGWEDMSETSFDTRTLGVAVWELVGVKPLAWLPTSGPVHSLAFSPNGQRLAAGTGSWQNARGGEIWIWKLTDSGFESPQHFQAHSGGVGSVAWWRDRQGQQWLVSGGWPAAETPDPIGVRIWNPLDGRWRADVTNEHGVQRLAVTPNGSICLAATRGSSESIRGGSLQLLDLEQQRRLRSVEIPEPIVFQIAIDPIGKFAMVATGYGRGTEGKSGRLYRWRFDDERPEVVDEQRVDISAVSFAAGGENRVVWSTVDGRVTWADYDAAGELSNHVSEQLTPLAYVSFAHAVSPEVVIIGGGGLLAQLVYADGRAAIDLNNPPRDQ